MCYALPSLHLRTRDAERAVIGSQETGKRPSKHIDSVQQANRYLKSRKSSYQRWRRATRKRKVFCTRRTSKWEMWSLHRFVEVCTSMCTSFHRVNAVCLISPMVGAVLLSPLCNSWHLGSAASNVHSGFPILIMLCNLLFSGCMPTGHAWPRLP